MKKMMLKAIAAVMMIAAPCLAKSESDVYDMTINAKMPRVYNNMESQGYRKYQTQKIVGTMTISYSEDGEMSGVSFSSFTNKTYKIAGIPVTYEVTQDEEGLCSFSWCGNNKTQRYDKPNCNFSIIMVPSYKIGAEMLDDVHLSIACTKGTKKCIKDAGVCIQIPYSLSGYCTGQIGCNCTAWGHVSPTRIWSLFGPSDVVTDVASVDGTVTLKWNKKLSR